MKKIPNAIYWFFTPDTIRNKKYLKDIDYLAEKTEIDTAVITMQAGVIREDYDQCHGVLKELVDYAHTKGIRIGLTLSTIQGFFNPGFDPNVSCEKGQAEIFTINDISKAQALISDYELTLDENGCSSFEHHAVGARNKVRPLYNHILKMYCFRKTGEAFYDPDTLQEISVSQGVQIIESRTHSLTADVDLGKEYAGYTFFIMVAQYYNWPELFGASEWENHKNLMDLYSDIPLDCVLMDEYGYMLLNSAGYEEGNGANFRCRFYSPAHAEYYKNRFHDDLESELFSMRYAPQGKPAVRMRAINRYFSILKEPVIDEEFRVANYAKKLFGEDIYIGCHNTFHNNIAEDEVWHTACAWWDLPREWGHTDEILPFPARMGILLSAPSPLMLHMYYSPQPKQYYREMITDAPFNIRIFHHALDDFYWGSSYRDEEMVQTIQMLDRQFSALNDFQTTPPKLDLLIIYGTESQYNWYPDENNRSVWDINKGMDVFGKCDLLWDAGYRAALIPDYAIEDGRAELKDGGYSFNGHSFTHCLFLYPRYAKEKTLRFLEQANKHTSTICIIGNADYDFDGNAITPSFPCYGEFDLSLLEKMGCPKSGIPHGSLYQNGGFCITDVSAWMDGKPYRFDFTADGTHYHGICTGLIAYRKGEPAQYTKDSHLFADDEQIF